MVKSPRAAERGTRRVAAFQLFAQRYARKARRGLDSNDRVYDRDIEKAVKRMPPAQFDAILRDGDE